MAEDAQEKRKPGRPPKQKEEAPTEVEQTDKIEEPQPEPEKSFEMTQDAIAAVKLGVGAVNEFIKTNRKHFRLDTDYESDQYLKQYKEAIQREMKEYRRAALGDSAKNGLVSGMVHKICELPLMAELSLIQKKTEKRD